jgi:hypothetical protein
LGDRALSIDSVAKLSRTGRSGRKIAAELGAELKLSKKEIKTLSHLHIRVCPEGEF